MTVRPKKYLGQHFLRDENIARKIVGYLNPEIKTVLEVGPGMGVLTKYLLVNPEFDPYFMELDRESIQYLLKTYPGISGRLIEADFLSYDLTRFPPSVSGNQTPFSIIGNFPYNISTQILFKALEHRESVKEVIGMFQKEVAERIASNSGNKSYGIISVVLQAFYEIEYLFTVNETVFYPPPKVKSAVIRLKRNATLHLGCDESLFTRVVKTAFNQRRKTLRNALQTFNQSPGWHDLEPFLSQRAEQLSIADFVKLTTLLTQK